MLVGWLEFSVPFQHKYGYIRAEHAVCMVCAKGGLIFGLCDEFAVALALDDRVATATEEAICSVDTSGSITRGQMVVDRQPLNTNSTTVRIVTALDLERCTQLVMAAATD